MSSEGKKLYKELHKVLVVHGYSTHRQTTYSKIMSKFQISFSFFLLFLKVAVLLSEPYFSTFLLWTNTNPTDTSPTTFGHEIVNNVENTLEMFWDFLSGFWNHEFDAFAFFFFVLTEHVRICVFSFFYTGGALESAFEGICKIWTKYMYVMFCFFFFNTFSCSFF